MPAIVDFPTIVKEALDEFGHLFANEPERIHFAEYLTGLLVGPLRRTGWTVSQRPWIHPAWYLTVCSWSGTRAEARRSSSSLRLTWGPRPWSAFHGLGATCDTRSMITRSTSGPGGSNGTPRPGNVSSTDSASCSSPPQPPVGTPSANWWRRPLHRLLFGWPIMNDWLLRGWPHPSGPGAGEPIPQRLRYSAPRSVGRYWRGTLAPVPRQIGEQGEHPSRGTPLLPASHEMSRIRHLLWYRNTPPGVPKYPSNGYRNTHKPTRMCCIFGTSHFLATGRAVSGWRLCRKPNTVSV